MADKTPFSIGQRRWVVGLIVAFGILAGLGLYTFVYAQGLSYFSNDPNACMNCHIMRDQFEGWNHSTHKAVAACNDCHTPHNNLAAKYMVKGINGFNHSLAFTLGTYPEHLRIRQFNADIAQANCLECHETALSMVEHVGTDEPLKCVRCHGNVGHDNVAHGP